MSFLGVVLIALNLAFWLIYGNWWSLAAAIFVALVEGFCWWLDHL